jgi:UDP-N-acetylmuramyl pentapeptide phosphotransferase/UDP-N-acetylglucosamine-1-phosphate transferase
MLPGICLLTMVGWRDDKLPVSSLLRLLVQLVVSLWLLSFFSFQFSLSDMAVFTATIVAMIWIMNLYNFMDGSNGMAGFQGIFAGMALAVLFYASEQYAMALLSLAVAAACAGFLPLNFPQASVFMGDVASVPLGFIFASLAVYGMNAGILSLSVSILIMSVFIIDATLTLFARVFRGERWYTAHAQHVYQRLIAQGWSHRQVLLVYQAINVILVLPAIVLAEIFPQYAMVTVGLTLLSLGACWHIANRRLGMLATAQLK